MRTFQRTFSMCALVPRAKSTMYSVRGLRLLPKSLKLVCRVPNQLCTAYAVCACCQITETSLHTPETKRCAYSVVLHVGMNVRFFLKFEERTLLQSQQLLLFPKKSVSVFSFSARCHHSCKDVLTFVSFFQNSKSLSFHYDGIWNRIIVGEVVRFKCSCR